MGLYRLKSLNRAAAVYRFPLVQLAPEPVLQECAVAAFPLVQLLAAEPFWHWPVPLAAAPSNITSLGIS
jgi:hypothetical protein